MAKKNSRDRMSNEINAGSMADIAFLLLIFFLVTTTIVEDKGITVKLPPWSEEDPDITKLKSRNVFTVLVNAQNDLLVRGESMDITSLREKTKEFITNPAQREDLAERPTKAIITLKNDRGTNYETYVSVYNELKAAYDELWDEMCLRKYGVKYSDDLPLAWRKSIKDEIPMVLSEAEPTNFGEEK
ncbi:MAG: biopolymer transporter ExbD [Saprospiraceae bacterium]|nr:biopolymer transporter ExbD [Saprospiraceae bacterium]MDP4700535.1 biopolymer transporter ExbD [Saprospiraceae bacterium]MDP4810153.1 biopolymer transporter ExbD [Saprospiraceae bacterium]MDP4814378.1 biopolymer transporter ExbD [Saprospiraceae bacterium]MDP4853672.1 biopolymer transporter ExbD [Saprospiraceae bacterium]